MTRRTRGAMGHFPRWVAAGATLVASLAYGVPSVAAPMVAPATRLGPKIDLGEVSVHAIAVNRSGSILYAAVDLYKERHGDGPEGKVNAVDVIDATSHQVLASIRGTGDISGVTLSPDEKTIYATTTFDRTSKIEVIDTATYAVTGTIGIDDLVNGLAVSPQGDRLYAITHFKALLQTVDLSTKSVVKRLKLGPTPTGYDTSAIPFWIVLSGSGARAYIGQSGGTGAPSTVVVVATPASTIVKRMHYFKGHLGSLGRNGRGDRILVGVREGQSGGKLIPGYLQVLDARTGRTLKTIPVGKYSPVSLASNGSGSRVFLIREFPFRMLTVNTRAGRMTSMIRVPVGSEGLVVDGAASKGYFFGGDAVGTVYSVVLT